MLLPQVDVTGDGQSTPPLLANTSIKSYVRANRMGCPTNATVDGQQSSPGTDMMYSLQLKVSAAATSEAGGLR